jgi:hypothetical protein
VSTALSSGLMAHSTVEQKPARRIEVSLRTGRQLSLRRGVFWHTWRRGPQHEENSSEQAAGTRFLACVWLGPMIVQPMKRCSMKRKSRRCAIRQ